MSLLETRPQTLKRSRGDGEDASRALSSPVQVVEAWLEVLCTADGTGGPVLKLDPIKAQHELIGPDETLSDLLGAFKCLQNNPLGAQVALTHHCSQGT